MIRLATVIETFKADLIAQYGNQLLPGHHRALSAMATCRSALSPRMQVQCEDCAEQRFVPHSCGHRACPHCQHHDFREMARTYVEVAPIRELRSALSGMRLANLQVGDDGRNRCLLSPFRARTGRNQPSNSKFIFGPSVWLRGLIQPKPGCGLAYVDWSQQEFGIAAALSGDPAMIEAYHSGDPYLAFAIQTGGVPKTATKITHEAEREQFKACVLAVQYGMGEASLAVRINQPVARARQLLELHRRTYRTFWKWSDSAVDEAVLGGRLWTGFG